MHDDPAAPQAVTGIGALFAVRAAMLGWYVVWILVLHLGQSSAALRDDHWWKLGTLVWTTLDLALLIVAVPFARGRRGRDAEVAALAFAVLAGIGFSTSALQSLADWGGLALQTLGASIESAVYLVARLSLLGGEVCLWLALIRATRAPREWSWAFYALVTVSAMLSAPHFVLSPEDRIALLRSEWQPVLTWGQTAVQLPTQALLLLLLFRMRQHGEPTDAVATRGEMTEAHESQPARDIAIGALWLAGGVAVTLLSMSGAKSGGGGRYVVTIGPIAYGLVRMVRGLARLGR